MIRFLVVVLVMTYLNINCLISHNDNLRIFMNQSKGIDILAINETKLDLTIKDNELHLGNKCTRNLFHSSDVRSVGSRV